jgi:hypothetical protein
MAIKKNKKTKQTKSRKVARMTTSPKKKVTGKARLKKATPRKGTLKKKVRGKTQSVAAVAFEPVGLRERSGGQAGDLQGLSSIAGADSESVDELLEEGNAFEAEVVKGVQQAADAEEHEVVAHEVPEDDVPEEYLGKDQ